jgi:hypothetical protein
MEKIFISQKNIKYVKDGLVSYIKKMYEHYNGNSINMDMKLLKSIINIPVLRKDVNKVKAAMGIVERRGRYTFEDIADAVIDVAVRKMDGKVMKMKHIISGKLYTTWDD